MNIIREKKGEDEEGRKEEKRRGEGRRGGLVKMDADWSNVVTSHVCGPQELENTVRMLLGAFRWSTALLTP